MSNIFIVLFLSLWTSHAAVDLYYIQNSRCHQHSFANDACSGLETEQQMIANMNFSQGTCADQGYAFVCPDVTPETSEAGCGFLSGNVRTNKTITEFCKTNPDCEKDWCGDVGMVVDWWAYTGLKKCSLHGSRISQEQCESKEPIEANTTWVWKQNEDGSYKCETTGYFYKSECQMDTAVNMGNSFYRYTEYSCQRYYNDVMTSMARRGETCEEADALTHGIIFQSFGCCGHDPNTTAAPTAAPVSMFSEVVNAETQETECLEISISPTCTVGVSQLSDYALGTCKSKDSSYLDVSDMFLPSGGVEIELLGCEDAIEPMTVSVSFFYKEHPKPASGWYAEQTFYDSGDCTGSPQFKTFITSDYFRFGVCKHIGDEDGKNMYTKTECTEDDIITRIYSDASCTLVTPDADVTSDGQCKKLSEVPGAYSKMIFSGACPAAEIVSGVTDFADGTVYTDLACHEENEIMIAGATSILDCWEKCNIVDSSVVSCFVEHTGDWDMCICQHACDTINKQHEVTMWLKDSTSKPTQYEVMEVELEECMQVDRTHYPDQYTKFRCYSSGSDFLRVRTYDNENCQGSPKFEGRINMTCSDAPFIAGDFQYRMSQTCDPATVKAFITQSGCGEALPWWNPTTTTSARPTTTSETVVESNTAALSIFISLLAFWATL